MDRDEMLRALDRMLAEGKISEETYNEILKRWKDADGEKNEVNGDLAAREEKEDMREDESYAAGEILEAEDYLDMDIYTGVFRDGDVVTITGSGVVRGDLSAEVLKVAGSAVIRGHLSAERVSVAGALSVEKGVRAETVKVAGELSCGGGMECSALKVAGALEAKGDVKAERLSVAGGITCVNLEFEHGTIAGFVKCEEMRGETLEWKLGRTTSEVRRMEVKQLHVKPRGRIFRGRLTAKEIEGEYIYLHSVKADIVRGEEVEIGPGCVIDLVEAKVMRISQRAKVNRRVRL